MQTHPFRSETDNSDIIKQRARVALRADESRIGYVFALINDGSTAIVHHDNETDMDFYNVADLIPLATVANDPSHYASTLI